MNTHFLRQKLAPIRRWGRIRRLLLVNLAWVSLLGGRDLVAEPSAVATEFFIDSGSGASATSTDRSLTSVLGELTAGAITSARFTLESSPWDLWGSASLPVPAPRLAVHLVGLNVVVSWPSTSVEYDLEETTLPGPARANGPSSWAAVNGPKAETGGITTMTLPISALSKFYRLKQR